MTTSLTLVAKTGIKARTGAYLERTGKLYLERAKTEITPASLPCDTFAWSPLSKTRNQVAKRVVDLLVGVVGITLSPIIAIAVKTFQAFFSPGPLLYWQNREGKYGEVLLFPKFRTMPMDHSCTLNGTGPATKVEPNMPKAMQSLRNWADEWPQFYLIFFGKMSLIGPRALMYEQLPSHDSDSWRLLRQQVAPGLTHMARVLYGGRSKGEKPYSETEMKMLELWYEKNWSAWLDTKLFFRTVAVILTDRNH